MDSTPPRAPTRLNHPSNSPDFQFCLDPSPPTLHSADQLFSGGFLLPLHLLPPPSSDPEPDPSPSIVTSSTGNPILAASKRWKDRIFKRGDTKHDEKSTDRIKRDKRGSNNNSAELNINIWPFSRSRSAGNNVVRSRPAGRKVSSAPCSRSNSSGSRRSMPNSPGRTGFHLGRTSPVWQVRRNRPGPGSGEACRGKPVGKGRVLNLNVPVPTCIGYRQQLSCRIDENAAIGGSGGGGGEGRSSSGGNGNSNLFSLRGLFSKKGVLTGN